MPVLFQHQSAKTKYRVEKHGKTISLYSNGVFHSEFTPGKLLTGSVWDLMLLPAFFHPPETVRRVLLLGLGGGVLVHQLKHFFPDVEIIAIDIDKTHILVARSYFAVNYPGVKLVHGDAIQWLKEYRGPQFDMVIDDLFWSDSNGLASRVQPLDRSWWFQLQSRVRESGSLVINFACDEELHQSCFYRNKEYSAYLPGRYRFQTPDCENSVVCLANQPLDLLAFNQRLRQQPLLDKTRKSCHLKYTVRPLPFN